MKYETNVFGLLTFSVLVVSARDRIINKERNNDGEGKFVIIWDWMISGNRYFVKSCPLPLKKSWNSQIIQSRLFDYSKESVFAKLLSD